MRVIGLMSGTSLDGIDAALVEIVGDPEGEVRWRVLSFVTTPYTAEQRQEIYEAIAAGGTAELCRLNARLGRWFADAASGAVAATGLRLEDVDLIGSHGQTIWHQPPADGAPGATLQLGTPAEIAERTGIPVVSDFRARDMAAGGQGAPLVPWADRLFFALPDRRRALQNLGGMGNVTWLPPRGDPAAVLAFDTGPGVALIDASVELATGGQASFDRDGERARRGRADAGLLEELLADPYFREAPPKSTGREHFGRPYVLEVVRRRGPASEQDWADLVTTLTELTARSVADAYRRWVLPRGVDEVVLTGGGSRNPVLRERIAALLQPVPVLEADVLGIDPDAKEALAFAALAWAHVRGSPGNVPEATGASGPRVLGSFTPGRRGRAAAGPESGQPSPGGGVESTV